MTDRNATCCHIDRDNNTPCPAAYPGDELFEVQLSEHPEDCTLSCRAHLGELIDSTAAHLGQPWRSSTVTPFLAVEAS